MPAAPRLPAPLCNDPTEHLMRDDLILCYARVGFAGKSPIAPGTCGSLVAIILAPVIFMPLPIWGRLLLLAFVLWTGTKASTKAEELLQKQDPGEVVIDEVLGQWITCLPFTALNFWGYLAAFLLFRLFDITKPWPVRIFERLPAGHGIMWDDAVAGLYAMLSLGVLCWLFG